MDRQKLRQLINYAARMKKRVRELEQAIGMHRYKLNMESGGTEIDEELWDVLDKGANIKPPSLLDSEGLLPNKNNKQEK